MGVGDVLRLVRRAKIHHQLILSQNRFEVDLGISFLVVNHYFKNSFLLVFAYAETHRGRFQIRCHATVWTAQLFGLRNETEPGWTCVQSICINACIALVVEQDQILLTFLMLGRLKRHIILWRIIIIVNNDGLLNHLLDEPAHSVSVILAELVSYLLPLEGSSQIVIALQPFLL